MKLKALVLAVLALAVLAGCRDGPEPRYEGPAGQGRLVFEPGKGIVRKGSIVSGDEQRVWNDVERAFNEKRYADCIAQSLQLSEAFPEGSRVVQAILLRIRARLEIARAEDSKLPRGIPLEHILFVYLAPEDDPRLRALMAREKGVAEYARTFRALNPNEFVERLRPDARELASAGQLDGAIQDSRILVTYYLPAQELREFRRQSAELTRDVTWLALAAGEHNLALRLADDLLALNPPPSVKGDTLYARGHILRMNGAHAYAADAFRRLFDGSGLRDTDTRWRPYALAWWIEEIMETSKGPLYDMVPYERALELVSEYELYRIENPAIDEPLRNRFVELAEKAYNVLILRANNAADAYDRLGEDSARDHYLQNAARLEAERDKRLARLRSKP